jgi:hypothetical protein
MQMDDLGWYDPDHDPMIDINKWLCSHSNRTEPDENGDAICFKCGSVIQIRFNMERFKKYLDDLRHS